MPCMRQIALAATAAFAFGSAQAAVISVNSLSANVTLQFSSLGAEGTVLNGPFALGQASVTGAPAFTLFQGSTYNAGFDPNATVLAMFDMNSGDYTDGTFDISFAAPVQGFATNITANLFGPYAGLLEVFNSANVLLGSFALNGDSGPNGDQPALFAGVMSDALDIAMVRFSGFGAGAAIGDLLLDTELDRHVPEPAALLLALGALGLMSRVRRSPVAAV